MYNNFMKWASSLFKKQTKKEPKYQNVQIKWDELTPNQCYDILYAITTNDRNLDIGRLKKKFPFVKYEVKQ